MSSPNPGDHDVIEVRNLKKTYADGTEALAGIDLVLGDGMFGLLGPNGAGKTTLLSILVLAQEPTSGSRRYFDIDDGFRQRPRIRSLIGYLPQEFDPIEPLSGIEYLLYCAEIRRVPLRRRDLERRAWALLDAVELTHAADRRSGTYSGGMIRRLGLAQALIHSPRFLVVDEPTAGLDPEERIRFRNLITDLAEEIPVLLSTHIVEDVEATCPRLGVIDHGRLLFDGAPGELMRRVDGCLWRLPVEAPTPHGAIEIGRRAGDGGEAFKIVHATQAVVDGEPSEPTLEEAFATFLTLATPELPSDSETS